MNLVVFPMKIFDLGRLYDIVKRCAEMLIGFSGYPVEIFFVDCAELVYYFVPYMNKEVTKKEPKWSKVNIKTSLLKDLQATALKARQTVPSIVGEAAEIWLRDVAPKRISLIAKSYSLGDILE